MTIYYSKSELYFKILLGILILILLFGIIIKAPQTSGIFTLFSTTFSILALAGIYFSISNETFNIVFGIDNIAVHRPFNLLQLKHKKLTSIPTKNIQYVRLINMVRNDKLTFHLIDKTEFKIIVSKKLRRNSLLNQYFQDQGITYTKD